MYSYSVRLRRNIAFVSAGLVGLLGLVAAVPAQQVFVTNVTENHYANLPNFGSSCGVSIPSGQYPSTYHLENGHLIHHYDPSAPVNDYWVFEAHFDNSSYSIAEVAFFKSATQCGSYILQTNLYTGTTPGTVTDPNAAYNPDGAGYGYAPGGWQARDNVIYNDPSTQTYNADGTVAHYADAYLYAASNSLNTAASASGSTCSYANDSIAAFHLTADYLHIDTSTSPGTNGANWISPCTQREGPVLFKSGSYYFLITSQAAGWYPSQAAYVSSTNPLTGFQATPLTLGNTSTWSGQSSGGVTITGTQATTNILTLNHLGGDDAKNPANVGSDHDSGGLDLPVILNGSTGVATMPWESSWAVDLTTGVLTLPPMTNLSLAATSKSTVTTATGGDASNASDGLYTTKWSGSATGSSSFTPAVPTGTVACPVTGATSTTTCYPSLIQDLGSVQPIQEIDLSFYMVKGSEEYITYKIGYSTDGLTWNTLDYTAFATQAYGSNSTRTPTQSDIGAIPFSTPITLGFNALPVNFSARYVALEETSVVQSNSTSPLYGPNSYEMSVIQSNAPANPLPVSVNVTSSTAETSPGSSFNVMINVTDPSGTSTPSGYVQLTNGTWISDTFGLNNAASATITVPAGVLNGGNQTITANFRPGTVAVPVYGLATTTGTVTLTIDAPGAPASLTVTPASPLALGLAWSASPGATNGYIVYRSVDGGSTFTQLTSVAAGTVTYTDAGLTSGNQYCYEVAATNAAGTGSPTASVCATASNNFPVNGLSVTVSGPGALLLSYTAVTNATSYLIKRATGSSTSFTTLTSSNTATSYSDGGLAAGTQYCYTVAANFSTGTGVDSSPVCATATAATAPLDVRVTPWASGQLAVSWVVNGSATSYVLKRATGSSGNYATIVTSQTALNYIDGATTALTNGTTYCYVIDEVYNGITSADSAPVCVAPVDTFINLTNGSFEVPGPSLWSTTPSYFNGVSGVGWTFNTSSSGSNTGNNSGEARYSTTTWFPSSCPTTCVPLGSVVGLLEGKGTLTQTLSGLTVGTVYTILVNAQQRANSLQSGGPEPFQVLVNGTLLGTMTPPQPAFAAAAYTSAYPTTAYFRDYGVSFKATSTSITLQLAGTSTSTTAAVLLDNVRVYANAAAVAGTYATPNYLWIGNANGSLTRTDEQGTAQNSNLGTTGSTTSYAGIAVDANGGIWSVNSGENLINYIANATAANTAGYAPATFTDGSLNAPSSLTIDGAGMVWITNFGSNTVSLFNAAGVFKSTVADSSLSGASSVAVDISGNVWLTNATGNTVVQIIGAATPVLPLASATAANTPAVEP